MIACYILHLVLRESANDTLRYTNIRWILPWHWFPLKARDLLGNFRTPRDRLSGPSVEIALLNAPSRAISKLANGTMELGRHDLAAAVCSVCVRPYSIEGSLADDLAMRDSEIVRQRRS